MFLSLLRTSLGRTLALSATSRLAQPSIRVSLTSTRAFTTTYPTYANAAKESTATKTATKKSTAKKSAVKKSAVKKPAAKKTTASKTRTAAKKPARKVVKKTVAKPKAKKVVKPKTPVLHKRDALGPKRIPSAWNKFLTEFFAQAKADGRIPEGQKIVAVSADARAAYKALTPEQQRLYGPSEEEKRKNKDEIAEWRANLNLSQKRAINKWKSVHYVKRRQTSPTLPFFMYVKENYHKLDPPLPFIEAGHVLREQFKHISPEEVERLKARAQAEFDAKKAAP